jgi:hypothetical protein
MKGLYDKYAVRHPHPAACAIGHDVVKVEFAKDEEGRLWRRIHRSAYGRRWGGYGQHWTAVTRWHIADPWAWFPGADPSSIEGARKQNTRARPPAKVDVYLIQGRIDIVQRPPYPPQPLREEISC